MGVAVGSVVLVGAGVGDGTGVGVSVGLETVGEEVGVPVLVGEAVGVNVLGCSSVGVRRSVAADGNVTVAITGGLDGASVGLLLARVPGASINATKPLQ
jgi:hypothetical protein